MKELTVISGKGGTGKTSLVASFAALAQSKVIADCDVDAADLHLVTAPRTVERRSFTGGKEAVIDPDLCNGCGFCLDLCRFGAISAGGSASSIAGEACTIDPFLCEGCGVCARFCEAGAIELDERTQGEWYISDTRLGPMVHARLGIAAENSGKLVSIIRNRAREIAREKSLEFVMVDGSPGIGCPVIASITGCDLVMAVTEPTLSGRHDLERVADLTAHFGIPLIVAVNKFDLNEAVAREIEEWCAEKKIAVAGRIPYCADFTAAMIACRSVVEYCDRAASSAIRELWTVTVEMLRNGEDRSGRFVHS